MKVPGYKYLHNFNYYKQNLTPTLRIDCIFKKHFLQFRSALYIPYIHNQRDTEYIYILYLLNFHPNIFYKDLSPFWSNLKLCHPLRNVFWLTATTLFFYGYDIMYSIDLKIYIHFMENGRSVSRLFLSLDEASNSNKMSSVS